MNERIRELSEQAQLYARQGMAKTVIELKRYDADVASERYAKDFEQKFAELIVKECINCCDEVDRINKAYIEKLHFDPENGPKECIQVIKEHFGVEE